MSAQGFRLVEAGVAGAGPKGSPGTSAARGFPGFRPKRRQPRPPESLHQIEKGKDPGPRSASTLRSLFNLRDATKPRSALSESAVRHEVGGASASPPIAAGWGYRSGDSRSRAAGLP
jgi:hypothetical protein